jgi:hypothetical protein
MVQNVLLIWSNNSTDDKSADWRNMVIQVSRAVDTINKLPDGGACIEFIEDLNNDNAFIIISDSLSQHIRIFQMDSVFIFSVNKKCPKP